MGTLTLGMPWDPERPRVLVAACSDGRLQEATDAFLSSALGVRQYDRLYVPAAEVVSRRAVPTFFARVSCAESASSSSKRMASSTSYCSFMGRHRMARRKPSAPTTAASIRGTAPTRCAHSRRPTFATYSTGETSSPAPRDSRPTESR